MLRINACRRTTVWASLLLTGALAACGGGGGGGNSEPPVNPGAVDRQVPLALSNLAARDQVGAAHIHITRHLAVGGSRLTELSERAGMSKQAMADLVDQCEAWGLLTREADAHDRRAKKLVFTASGRLWLDAFRRAVAQAEAEFQEAVGRDVATVVALGLEAYAGPG